MKRLIYFSVFISLLALSVGSCKKYADPPPYFEENTDTLLRASRRILFIGISGAVGSEYKTIAPPKMVELKANSKFSWDAVADEGTTDAASWKTLLTGVSYNQHLIRDSSFAFSNSGSGGDEHDPIKQYPSFFNYLLGSAKSDLKTGFVSTWSDLLYKVVPEIETKVLAANDAAVKDSVVAMLKNQNQEIVLVDFNSVAIAGKQHGFSAEAAGYKDAVLKVDGYIGEIIAALKSRPEFDKSEEWLVIINGTHGGIDHSYGGITEPETNVPSFYWNPRFASTELTRQGAFSGVEFKGTGAQTIKGTLTGEDIYNVGTGEQTIQLKVKGLSGNWPHFFSKTTRWMQGNGWSVFSGGNLWAVSVYSNGTERRVQSAPIPGPVVFDNRWHTLTFAFFDSAGGKWIKRFTDNFRIGDADNLRNLTAVGDFSSPSPIYIGWGSDPNMGASAINVADVKIFNTALTDQEIRDGLCVSDITKHPKYANLTGYWPGNDGFGGRMKNKAPNAVGKDFLITGPYAWNNVSDLPCNIPAITTPGMSPLMIKNVDFATTVFYWLRLTTSESWGFSGSTWLSNYELEFVK